MNLKNLAVSFTAVALLAMSACSGQKAPATQAVAAAETALAAIKDDAAKFLPGELQGVESTLAKLKADLAKGDYKAVVASAPGLMSGIDGLKTNVAAKVEQAKSATTEWASYATDLPKMVDAIQSRVGVLSSSKKLPKGVDSAALDSAKAGLAWMQSTWAEATAAFTGGNSIDAVDKAKAVKAKGQEVLKLLGMGGG